MELEMRLIIAIFWTIFFTLIVKIISPLTMSLFDSWKNVPQKLRNHFHIRSASSVHSLVVTPLAIIIVLTSPSLNSDRGMGSDENYEQVALFSLGYFIHDLIFTLWEWQGYPSLFHAIFCLSVYSYTLAPFLQFYTCALLIFEASTPLINSVWQLDKLGVKNKFLMGGLMALTVVIFFLARIVFGTFISYRSFQCLLYECNLPHPSFLRYYFVGQGAILECLNYFWFTKIIQFCLSKLNKPSSPSTSTSSSSSSTQKKAQ